MKEISETGYWNGQTAHVHHVHSKELSNWICKFFEDKQQAIFYDMGCGLGNYLKDLKEYGYHNLLGFEGNIPKNKVFDKIEQRDLTVPFQKSKKGHVISLEVGEHIPAEYMNVYLDNICNNCSNYLITSWAIRGQEGFGHVNCLDNLEIIPHIEKRGFEFLADDTMTVRNINLDEAPWFKNTLLIFKKNEM